MLFHWNPGALKAALPLNSELRNSAKENENGDVSKFSAPADIMLTSNSNHLVNPYSCVTQWLTTYCRWVFGANTHTIPQLQPPT